MDDNNKDITLTITFKSDGQVLLNGPLENKILCMGLLEIAKGLVMQRGIMPKIIVPSREIKIN